MEVLPDDKLNCICCFTQSVPRGCKDAVLTEPLFKNCTINCLTFEGNTKQPYKDNLCLFCALALRSHGNERLEEETSKLFILLMSSTKRFSFSQFQGAHMNDIPIGECLLFLNILFYDLDIVEGNFIYDLARRNMQKHEITVRLL